MHIFIHVFIKTEFGCGIWNLKSSPKLAKLIEMVHYCSAFGCRNTREKEVMLFSVVLRPSDGATLQHHFYD